MKVSEALAPEVATDVITLGAALAGFILVYLGALSTSYGSYAGDQQSDVRSAFIRRAWFSFVGILISLASTAWALYGRVEADLWAVTDSAILSAIAIFCAGAIAGLALLDIK